MPLGGSACYTRPKVARPSPRNPNELENHNRKNESRGRRPPPPKVSRARAPPRERSQEEAGADVANKRLLMSMSEAEARAQGRREAAPAAFLALFVIVMLAIASWARGWELLGLPWWVWLLLGVPALLLAIDVSLTFGGRGLVRTRKAALFLLGLLVLGNFIALAILVTGLVTTSTKDLGGGELLLTGFAIWATDVVVFALLFWELDAGGPAARIQAAARAKPDFQFPQDENPELAAKDWTPQAWDYGYLALTNAIAFSPTDVMPLSLRAKATMGLESAISAVIVLLVAARAVNVLGS
jgi:hypothetical protein